MRYQEIKGGIRIWTSEEESKVVNKIKKDSPYPRKELDDREQELADRLVAKNILNKKKGSYTINGLEKLEREDE